MTRARGEAGFALPFAVFLIMILTFMFAASSARFMGERFLAESSGATVSAQAVARSGLQSYLASQTTRPNDGDSVRINVVGGYTDVIATVVRRPADTLANWLFIVRSTGHVIEPMLGPAPQAQSTTAQYVQWQSGRIDVRGAFTAANGLGRRSGTTIDIRGEDQSSCGGGTVPGVRVPSGGDPGSSGITPDPVVYGWGADVARETNIDWAALSGGGFNSDYTGTNTAVRMDGTYSTQLITGNATLGGGIVTTGTGLLIVTGDLAIQSSFMTPTTTWNGIIVVGGVINFKATTTQINGMAVSGLAQPLPAGDEAPANFGETNKTVAIWHHACNIRQSLAGLTGFAPIRNGWVDNWAGF